MCCAKNRSLCIGVVLPSLVSYEITYDPHVRYFRTEMEAEYIVKQLQACARKLFQTRALSLVSISVFIRIFQIIKNDEDIAIP